jgi:hypothetical protein
MLGYSRQLIAATNNSVADVQLHLLLLDTNGGLSAESPIAYELRASPSNQSQFIFLPDDRYLCQVELVDQKGIAVPKKASGKQFGSLFGNLEPHPKYIRDQGPFNIFLNSSNEIRTSRIKLVGGGLVAPILSRPMDIFDITNPGEYTMKLHFQFVEWTNETDPHVIQLPIVEVKVHK